MDIEYEREEKDYPELAPNYFIGVAGHKFSFEKGFIVNTEDKEYKTIETVFRREFPIGYPEGINGERKIVHKWLVRAGNTYYTYQICRFCFDVRVITTEHTPKKFVQTGLCPPCRTDPHESRKYWDAIYCILCSSPLLGERFEFSVKWKLARFGYDISVFKMGPVQGGTKVQDKVRDISENESSIDNYGSDSESYDL